MMKSGIYWIGIVLLIALLSSCKESKSVSAPMSGEIIKENISWAKRSHYKMSFSDENEKYEKLGSFKDEGLMKQLLEAVEKGELDAYHYYDHVKLDAKAVNNIYHEVDTITVVDPETFEEEIKVVENDLDWSRVTKFRVKQDWYFDEKSMQMHTKIVGMAPTLMVIDENMNYRGDLPLYWIFFEDAPPPLKD